MNGNTGTRPGWTYTILLGAASAVVGAFLALAAPAAWDRVDTEPDAIDASTQLVSEEVPLTLDDAIHAAAEDAVDVEGGRYKGESLEVARIEVTANNPHITAYRVVLQPPDS